MFLVVFSQLDFDYLFFVSDGIGPPGVRLDLSDTLLHIIISPPGGAEDEVMRDHYDLSYRILYWKNSSDEVV